MHVDGIHRERGLCEIHVSVTSVHGERAHMHTDDYLYLAARAHGTIPALYLLPAYDHAMHLLTPSQGTRGPWVLV